MPTRPSESAQGVLFGFACYGIWGGFPLFFSLFEGVPSWEVLIHRVVWSCVFLAGVVTLLGRWAPVRQALAEPRNLGRVLLCAVLIAINWVTYIHAIETRQVLQASLGYFLTPLVNVALGLVVLKERISRPQALAVLLAMVAITLPLLTLGSVPYLSLILAFSFGTYGLARKRVPLDGLSGLFVETLLLLPLGLLAFGALSALGQSHFGQDRLTLMLLVTSGVLTAIPLLFFAGAARRLRLATLGFLMYLNPTIQFLLALLVFGETLQTTQMITFPLIWLSLALYSWSSWRERPRASLAR